MSLGSFWPSFCRPIDSTASTTSFWKACSLINLSNATIASDFAPAKRGDIKARHEKSFAGGRPATERRDAFIVEQKRKPRRREWHRSRMCRQRKTTKVSVCLGTCQSGQPFSVRGLFAGQGRANPENRDDLRLTAGQKYQNWMKLDRPSQSKSSFACLTAFPPAIVRLLLFFYSARRRNLIIRLFSMSNSKPYELFPSFWLWLILTSCWNVYLGISLVTPLKMLS